MKCVMCNANSHNCRRPGDVVVVIVVLLFADIVVAVVALWCDH